MYHAFFIVIRSRLLAGDAFNLNRMGVRVIRFEGLQLYHAFCIMLSLSSYVLTR